MVTSSQLGRLQLGGGQLGSVSTGGFDFRCEATATAGWTLTPQTFVFTVDGVSSALWILKVLAGWYAELTFTASWDLSTAAEINDWEAGGLFTAEWELVDNAAIVFEVNGTFTAEWLGPSGGKDPACIAGDGIATAGSPGDLNYVF
jgi:hypothetical protein